MKEKMKKLLNLGEREKEIGEQILQLRKKRIMYLNEVDKMDVEIIGLEGAAAEVRFWKKRIEANKPKDIHPTK